MSELLLFTVPFISGLVVGILIGMGLQVRSEIRWMRKNKSDEPKSLSGPELV